MPSGIVWANDPNTPYEVRQQQLSDKKRRAIAEAQEAQKQLEGRTGQMVGGRYIAPHWLQRVSDLVGVGMSQYEAAQAANAEREAAASEASAAQTYLKQMPRGTSETTEILPAEDLGGITNLTETKTTKPTRDEMIDWAASGMVRHPSLRATLTKALEDQMIQEPIREEARQERVETKAADRLARAEANRAKLEQEAKELAAKLESGALDRAEKAKASQRHDEILLEIARGNQALRRLQIEAAASRVEAKEQAKKDEKENKAAGTSAELRNLLNDASALVPDATSSGIGSIRDQVAGFVGKSTDAGDKAAQLKVIGGNLVSKMPRMEGPQSDRDVKMYQEMAGRIGDPTVPASQKLKAIETLHEINNRYRGQNPSVAPNSPKVGEVRDGYVYLGGDPSKQSSWRQK